MMKTLLSLTVFAGAVLLFGAAHAAGIGGDEIRQPEGYPGYCSSDWLGKISCYEGSNEPWWGPGIVQSAAHILESDDAGNGIEGRHLCGAVLVAPDWVLTAASCVTGANRRKASAVGFGYMNWETGALTEGVIRPVMKIVVHPNYRKGRHDLALVRFEEDPAVHIANPLVSPASPEFGGGNLVFPRPQNAKFPLRGTPDIPFSDIVTSGFQADSPNENTILYRWSRTGRDKKLYYWATPLFEQPRKLCNQMREAGDREMHENVYCAVSHERTICPSDAGAPVMGGNANFKWNDKGELEPIFPRELLVVAITSWDKSQCAEPGEPGRFTYVSPYQDWIRGVLAATYDKRKRDSMPFSKPGE